MLCAINVTGANMDDSEKRRERLNRIMERLKMSNRELARRSGLHHVSITRYRNGDVRLNDVETLEKLAMGLGINVCYFFIDDEKHLDTLEKAVTLLHGKESSAQALTSTIQTLYTETSRQPDQGANDDLRKDVAEMKTLLQQLLNDPPGKVLNFTPAVAPRKSAPPPPKK